MEYLNFPVICIAGIAILIILSWEVGELKDNWSRKDLEGKIFSVSVICSSLCMLGIFAYIYIEGI